MTPLISIIIPTYNREKTILSCVSSVQARYYENIEIIIVNDGSTDSTENVLRDFTLNDSRVKLINQKNKGPGSARKTGINQANGEYIGFVDSDDWIEPNMYSSMINFLQECSADIVCCNMNICYKDGKNKYFRGGKNEIITLNTKEALKQVITLDLLIALFIQNCIKKNCSVMKDFMKI